MASATRKSRSVLVTYSSSAHTATVAFSASEMTAGSGGMNTRTSAIKTIHVVGNIIIQIAGGITIQHDYILETNTLHVYAVQGNTYVINIL